MVKVKINYADGTKEEFWADSFCKTMTEGRILYWMLDEKDERAFSVAVDKIKNFTEEEDGN